MHVTCKHLHYGSLLSEAIIQLHAQYFSQPSTKLAVVKSNLVFSYRVYLLNPGCQLGSITAFAFRQQTAQAVTREIDHHISLESHTYRKFRVGACYGVNAVVLLWAGSHVPERHVLLVPLQAQGSAASAGGAQPETHLWSTQTHPIKTQRPSTDTQKAVYTHYGYF